METHRPAASVIVPFAGPQKRLEVMLHRLGALELRPGDEAVLVDNRPPPSPPCPPLPPGVRVLTAPWSASPWGVRGELPLERANKARAAGAAATSAEWLVFIDADTRPVPALLSHYLDLAPGPRVGVLAGGVRDWSTAETPCSRYVSVRGKMDQGMTLAHPYRPYAQTANCAVRRSAFEETGGFAPGAGSSAAADADLCWRLQEAGWLLESRPEAVVDHENRGRFRDLYRQLARHGAGLSWLERHYPGSAPPPGPRELLGRIPHYLNAAARAGGREEALFALVDLICLYARDVGRLRGQAPPTRAR